MKKRRVFALIGVFLLVALYLSTLIFSLMEGELATNLLIISIIFTIFIPTVLQCCIMIENIPNTVKQVADLMEKGNAETKDEQKKE